MGFHKFHSEWSQEAFLHGDKDEEEEMTAYKQENINQIQKIRA